MRGEDQAPDRGRTRVRTREARGRLGGRALRGEDQAPDPGRAREPLPAAKDRHGEQVRGPRAAVQAAEDRGAKRPKSKGVSRRARKVRRENVKSRF